MVDAKTHEGIPWPFICLTFSHDMKENDYTVLLLLILRRLVDSVVSDILNLKIHLVRL